MNKFTSIGKTALRIFLYVFIVVSFVLCLGCDSSNSDAYGWNDAQATPDSGDAMNAGSNAPPRPTPARPTPVPENATPTPTPEAMATPKPTPTPAPTRRPHNHEWQTLFRENFYTEDIEVTVYICLAPNCLFSTQDQASFNGHASYTVRTTDDNGNQLESPEYICNRCGNISNDGVSANDHLYLHREFDVSTQMTTVTKSWLEDTGREMCAHCGETRDG